MEDPVIYRGVVYPWHCDHIRHMNVMWYVGKFDEVGRAGGNGVVEREGSQRLGLLGFSEGTKVKVHSEPGQNKGRCENRDTYRD